MYKKLQFNFHQVLREGHRAGEIVPGFVHLGQSHDVSTFIKSDLELLEECFPSQKIE